VSGDEQRRLACTFVALEPGVILHYDDALDGSTRRKLERKGVELVPFAAEAMHAGGGSLRCITLRLCRAKQAAEKRKDE
jgi:arginine deiminase